MPRARNSRRFRAVSSVKQDVQMLHTRARAGRDVCQVKPFATGAPLARALALSQARSLLPLRQTTGIDNRYGQQHCVTHWPKGHRATPGELLFRGTLFPGIFLADNE